MSRTTSDRGDFISERFKDQKCDQAGRMRVTPRDPAGVNRLYSTIVLDFFLLKHEELFRSIRTH